ASGVRGSRAGWWRLDLPHSRQSNRAADQARFGLHLDLDIAVSVSRADDGGVFSLAEKSGFIDLHLGAVARRRPRRCSGYRDRHDCGDVTPGNGLLDLRSQTAACGVIGVKKINHKESLVRQS